MKQLDIDVSPPTFQILLTGNGLVKCDMSATGHSKSGKWRGPVQTKSEA